MNKYTLFHLKYDYINNISFIKFTILIFIYIFFNASIFYLNKLNI